MLKIQEKNYFRPLEPPKAASRGKINSKPPRPPAGVGRGRNLATSPIPPENLLKNHPIQKSPLRRPNVASSPVQLLKDDKENDLKENLHEVPIIKEELKQESTPLRRPCKTAKWGFSRYYHMKYGSGCQKSLQSKVTSPPAQFLKEEKEIDLNGNVLEDPKIKEQFKQDSNSLKVTSPLVELSKEEKENDFNGNVLEVRKIKEQFKQDSNSLKVTSPPVELLKEEKENDIYGSALEGSKIKEKFKQDSNSPKVASPVTQLLKEEKVNDLNGNVLEVSKMKEEFKQDSNYSAKKDFNEKILMSSTPMTEKSEKNFAIISLEKPVNLLDYAQKLPHTGSKFFEAELEMEIPNLGKPIGIALLPQSKRIVIGDTASDQVKMFSNDGGFLKYINPPFQFERPSDMIAFENDEFAIKDNVGIHIFDENGDFKKSLINPKLGKLFGLATDGKDHLFSINTNKFFNENNMTKGGEADIVVMKISGSGEISKRIELVDVIADKSKTACRFLHYADKMLFIVDLGLDCVYQLKLKTSQAKRFGATGSGNGRFIDPAGLDTDADGNIIINDAGNNRLQVRITTYLILRIQRKSLARSLTDFCTK